MSHYDEQREAQKLEEFKKNKPSWANVLLKHKAVNNVLAWAESFVDGASSLTSEGLKIALKTAYWDIVEDTKPEPDLVKKPKHYMFFDTEAIKVIRQSMTKEQFKGYCKGNALQYRLRAGKKDAIEQEIKKAEEYELIYEEYKDGVR